MIEFRLLDDDGVELVSLPDVESFSLSPVLSDQGAIEFSYPRDGTNWAQIKDRDELRLTIYIDGVRQPQLDSWLKEVAGDDAEDANVWKFSGYFNNGRLAEALVYPRNWPTVDPQATKQIYASATVGTIIKTLMQQAQDRGTLTDVTTASFTGTHDSNGEAWDKLLSIEYTPQLDYLSVLRNLNDQRLVEFEMVGNDLRLYLFESLSTDRTTGVDPLVFRKGRDLTDSPRKRSTRDLGTVMLASGGEGLYLERVDAPGVASRRRIEKKASQGQVKDIGTLTVYADAQLEQIKQAKMEKTHGLSFAEGSPRPIRDFNVGDWAYSDMGVGPERLRIKQWVLSLDASGELSGSVTLNDFFAEQNEVLAKRVEGIVGGSTITGASEATDVPADLVDNLAPSTPAGLSLSSDAYMDNQGHTFGQMSASWLQVTTNEDLTICEDLEGYRIRWKYQSQTDWRVIDNVAATVTSWSPVTPGVAVDVQVQAYDRAGNASDWSASQSITTGSDATPPERPSAPTVDNYLGLIRIRWDGATASGAAKAPDQMGVEVHVSAVSGFTPDNTTRTDTLSAAGSSFYEAPYGSPRYVKLVAFDYNGNKSTASDQGSASSEQVVSADVFDGAIGSAKLADLAVTTAKINLLAVNDAQIGSVSVGKLTAGIINAEVTISGRIATALTGARREMNGLGFQAWDAANNLTISLDGSSNLLTGVLKTALSGRRIEVGAGGALGEINLYSPDGRKGTIRSFTEATGIEAMQLVMSSNISSPSSPFWNRFNINSDAWWTAVSYRQDWIVDDTFRVFKTDAASGGANGVLRFQVSDAEFAFWHAPVRFQPFLGNTSEDGEVLIVRTDPGNGSTSSSAQVQFVNPAGYGTRLKMNMTLSPPSNLRFEVRDVNDSGYAPIWASAFTVSSDRRQKRAIRNLDIDGLSIVEGMKLRSFERKEEPGGRRHLGVVAQEAPAEIVQGDDELAVDLVSWLTVHTSAIQQLINRVRTLEGK